MFWTILTICVKWRYRDGLCWKIARTTIHLVFSGGFLVYVFYIIALTTTVDFDGVGEYLRQITTIRGREGALKID